MTSIFSSWQVTRKVNIYYMLIMGQVPCNIIPKMSSWDYHHHLHFIAKETGLGPGVQPGGKVVPGFRPSSWGLETFLVTEQAKSYWHQHCLCQKENSKHLFIIIFLSLSKRSRMCFVTQDKSTDATLVSDVGPNMAVTTCGQVPTALATSGLQLRCPLPACLGYASVTRLSPTVSGLFYV